MLGLQRFLLLLPAWPAVGAVVGGDVVVLLHAVAAVHLCLPAVPSDVVGGGVGLGILLPLSAPWVPSLSFPPPSSPLLSISCM